MQLIASKSDLRKIDRELKKVDSDVVRGMKEVVSGTADDIAETAKDLVKKVTGSLGDSIEIILGESGLYAEIEAYGNKSEGDYYAVFVEYGTLAHGPPQPFMVPAGKAHEHSFVQESRKVIKRLK